MPNKTIYVKESDLPLYEKISASGEDSVSAKFADFLRFEDAMRQPQKIQFTPMPEVATLRDQFAIAAMTGDWAAQRPDWHSFSRSSAQETFDRNAELYYRMADSMLKTRML